MAELVRVFVSYASETDKEKKIINDLKKFDSKISGIKLIIDKKELKTGYSIKGFSKTLSEGDKIVIVFSDAYFKSKWCMSELLDISKTGHFEKRVFPIVVGNCDLSSSEYRAQLKKFWGEKKSTSDNSQEIVENLDKILDLFSHLRHISFDELKSNNYKELKEFIQPKLPSWVPLTVIGLLCLVAVFGFISFSFSNQLDKSEKELKDERKKISNLNKKINDHQVEEEEKSKKEIAKRLSLGDKYYLEASFDKRIAAKESALTNIGEAKSGFERSLDEMPDDPEALIYWENFSAKASARAYDEGESRIRTIAVSVPIQKNITVAKEILRGVAQAQKTINKQWLEGCDKDVKNKDIKCPSRWLLQVLIASDDNDPEIAKDIARYIAEERKDILAVIGHNSSQVSNAVINEYQNKLIMISPTSYTLDFSAKEIINAKNNYIFSVVSPVESVLPVIIDHIKSLESVEGNRNVYFCADPVAHDTARLINGLDKKITLMGVDKEKDSDKYKIECDISNLKGDDKFLDKAKEKYKLTDLFLSVHVSNSIDAIIMARKNKKSKLNLYSVHTLFSKDVIGKDLDKLIVAVNWHSKSPHDNEESKAKSKDFMEDAKCIWNGKEKGVDECSGKFDSDIDITWRSAMAYDATQLIIEGLNKIPLQVTGDKARKELQEQVSGLELDGVTGPIKFENGMRKEGKGHLVQVLERCDGKYQFVPLEKQNDSSYKLVFPEEVKFKDSNPKAQCK